MKIFLPVFNEKNDKTNKIFDIEEADYAFIFDSETKNSEIVTMQSISVKRGNLMLALKRKKIEYMICNGLPNISLELFTLMGIKTYKATKDSISNNINSFLQNELSLLEATSLYRVDDACSYNCSSCNTSCN